MSNTQPPDTDHIVDFLWQANSEGVAPQVIAILDGAQDRRIEPMINNSKLTHRCLYEGKISYALKRAAPHIVELERHHPFTEKLFDLGWGKSWGIFAIIYPPVDAARVRRNCRQISRVLSPTGKNMTLRYYDPRILRALLPVCNRQELERVFGPVCTFAAEIEGGSDLLKFQLSAASGDLGIRSLANNECRPDAPQRAVPSAAGSGFFRLRAAHMEAFKAQFLERQFQPIKDHFLSVYEVDKGQNFELNGRTVDADTFLRACFFKALEFKFTTNIYIVRFFNLCMQYEWGFWESEEILAIMQCGRSEESRLRLLDVKLMDLWYGEYI